MKLYFMYHMNYMEPLRTTVHLGCCVLTKENMKPHFIYHINYINLFQLLIELDFVEAQQNMKPYFLHHTNHMYNE